MKLNGKAMMMVAVVLGATAALMGCNKADADANALAPEESVATAPIEEESSATPGTEDNEMRFQQSAHYGHHYYAPHGPPPARYERHGNPPSARHFWAPGYYRWNGREHVWIGGRWELRRDHYEYIAPYWVVRFGRWEYIPGHWVHRY